MKTMRWLLKHAGKVVVMDRPKVVRRYVRGWFFVDFFAIVISAVDFVTVAGVESVASLKVLRVVRVLRLAKLLRLVRLTRLMRLVRGSSGVRRCSPKALP